MEDFATWKEKNKARWVRVYEELIAPDFEEAWKKSMCIQMHYSKS